MSSDFLDHMLAIVNGICPRCGQKFVIDGFERKTATGGKYERTCPNGHSFRGSYHVFRNQ